MWATYSFFEVLMAHFIKQGIDDALIQPYSGHESHQSLEIYSRLSITQA